MQCPIILLADSDAKYLRPLELKFLTELSEKIELEIITDRDYFDQYFSQPRTLSVLIVSEEWYQGALEQHNISNIFVLSESYVDVFSRSHPRYLFKYSSSNEIFQAVVRELEGRLLEIERINKETKVVVVTSASGGVGKTTVALGIAENLAMRGQRVLYIDAERINTFQYWFDDCIPMNDAVYIKVKQSTTGIYNQIKSYVGKHDFDYVPPFKNSLVNLGISFEFYGMLIQEAKCSQDYDVIIVDTDTIFDEEKASLMTRSDVLVTIVKQTRMSLCAANELLKNMRINSTDKYLFICNDFHENAYNALTSSNENSSFIISEYMHHIETCEELTLEDLKVNKDIQKISYLIN